MIEILEEIQLMLETIESQHNLIKTYEKKCGHILKPKPKELWINEYKNEFISYREKHMAVRGVHNHAIRVAVHYKEVIEE